MHWFVGFEISFELNFHFATMTFVFVTFHVHRQMLEDVVQMKLYLKKGERCTAEHSEDSETWKVCGIKYLSDLQSKLMLVAGKAQEGKKDVEVFNRVRLSFTHFTCS